MTGMHIEFITHACLKFSGKFGTLLCDPWLLNEPVANFVCWKFPAAVIPPEDVVRGVDFVFITHCHEDHFHLPSINYLPRDVQLILPEYDSHPGLRAQTMEITLRAMGFYNIRKLGSWESFDLGDGARLTVVPSAESRYYEWENSGFVLEYDGTRILNMNDNVSDEKLCRDISARFPGGFDIGFVQAAGCTMYPGCFVMSEDEMRAEVDQRQISMGPQRQMIELIAPRAIAPIAGDFAWYADEYFHNNWASRATPEIFGRLLENAYPDVDMDMLVFYPTDSWTRETGLVRNHPEINWANMLDLIAQEARRFRPKIDAIRAWVGDVERTDLEGRSRAFTALVECWITRDNIDFSARFRHCIEGPNSGFEFVLKASPEAGFAIDWNDDGAVDQTLYVPEGLWAAIVAGKLLWTEIQWNGKALQHVEFRPEMARFWYWLEYYIGLNNKQIQGIIEPRLYPHLAQPIDPTRGVFPMPDEWERTGERRGPRAAVLG